MTRITQLWIPSLALSWAATSIAAASVVVTTSYVDWQNMVGAPITQLTFEGIGLNGGGFSNQYSSYGVIDPEPNDELVLTSGRWTLQSMSFPPPTITFLFDTPITAIGWTSIVNQTASLYLGGFLVASSVAMPGGAGWTFAGLVSDLAFDKVVITHPVFGGGALLDDLWFQTIPSAPTLALVVLAGVALRRRRS